MRGFDACKRKVWRLVRTGAWGWPLLVASALHAQDKQTPSVRVETGAPRPPVQSVGVPEKAPTPGTPPVPTIKVGGGLILAYFHPWGFEESSRRQGAPSRKPSMEAFRANILLDSKFDRWGVHIDFRARDKRLRSFSDGTAWLEEAYVSLDLLKADHAWGPLTLKVGKAYAQFGRFFDYQFYGNMGLRDGFKIDPNYGVSLEGILGREKLFGARYYGQYFALDGGTNTSIDGRDTLSNQAPLSGFPNNTARKRNMFVARIEPFLQPSKLVTLRLGGSVQNFTADWGPTLDQGNVLRYGGDVTADVAWFGAWAEFVEQRGKASLTHPFPAAAAVDMASDPYGRPSSPARPARASDHIRYLIAGGRFAFKGVMLRYHFSSADYMNVTYPTADIRSVELPKVTVRETIHTPGISIMFTPQISLWIEHPIWKRHMDAATLALPASAGGRRNLPAQEWTLDKQVVVTLHGVI